MPKLSLNPPPITLGMSLLAHLFTTYLTRHVAEEGRFVRLAALIAEFPGHADLISRANYSGHITASGFVLSPDHTRILLIAHRFLGIHVQPGGHLDLSDPSPSAGARREILEETGITNPILIPVFGDPEIPFDIDTHYIPENPRKGEPEHWHHDFRYFFQCEAETPLSLAELEVEGAAWVPVAELRGYPTFERVGVKLAEYLTK